MQTTKSDMVKHLQQQINAVQHRKLSGTAQKSLDLGDIEQAFPNGILPRAAVHEFISYDAAAKVATNGFVSALIGRMQQSHHACLWVSTRKSIFPPALQRFGIDPARVIFINQPRYNMALWAMEEGLRCKSLTIVVAEIPELTFQQSRRLQLAVEESLVTGFIHRQNPKAENTTACVSRWKVRPIASRGDDAPGLGLPCWDVTLEKVRNGIPSHWQVQYADHSLSYLPAEQAEVYHIPSRKAG